MAISNVFLSKMTSLLWLLAFMQLSVGTTTRNSCAQGDVVSVKNDARVDAPRLNAQTAGREVGVGMVVGADARVGDVLFGQSCCNQLLSVALGQVDVPFVLAETDGGHVKSGSGKGIIHFVAHLTGIQRDTRTDDCPQRLWLASERLAHGLYGELGDALHGATPAGMDSGRSMVLGVIDQHRYAIGGGNTDADAADAGDEGIDPLESHAA